MKREEQKDDGNSTSPKNAKEKLQNKPKECIGDQVHIEGS